MSAIRTQSQARESARSAGFKSARIGRLITDNPYTSKELRQCFEKGYREFEEKVRSIRK